MEKKLKFNFLLVDREISKKVTTYLQKLGFSNYFSFYGKGSASSTVLDYLGIGETEKNILVYPAGEEDSIMIMDYIKKSEYFKKLIIFRVPVKGISSLKSLKYFLREEDENE